MTPTTQPRIDGGGVPSKNATPPEEITGVKCFGCGKFKRIVTHSNLKKQGFCQCCNMKLIRKFGPKYGQVLADPKAALEALQERKEEKSDLKLVRRTFFTLLTLMEEHDLESEDKTLVFQGFENVLVGLPEAEGFFNVTRKKAEK